MKLVRALLPLAALLALVVHAQSDDTARPSSEIRVPLKFEGGHKTEVVDRGRPVVLVAAALGVPSDVFRDAFSHVHPAAAGTEPQSADVQQNKRELLSRLGKYGVTNERLDEVSNYYRYPPGSHDLWRHVDAAGFAIVRGNKVVRVEITEHGAGYTTPPMVSVPGVGLTQYLVAQLDLNTNLARNGSVATIKLSALGDNEMTKMIPRDHTDEIQSIERIQGQNRAAPPPPR